MLFNVFLILPHVGEVIRTKCFIQKCVSSQLEMSETPQTCNWHRAETVLGQVPKLKRTQNVTFEVKFFLVAKNIK